MGVRNVWFSQLEYRARYGEALKYAAVDNPSEKMKKISRALDLPWRWVNVEFFVRRLANHFNAARERLQS